METCILREKTEYDKRPKDGYGYIYIYYYNERMLYVGQTRQSVAERYTQHYKHDTNTAGAKITNRIVWFCIKEECLNYMEALLFNTFDGICQWYTKKAENCKIKQEYKEQCRLYVDLINQRKLYGYDSLSYIMCKQIDIKNINHMPVNRYVESLFLLYNIQDIIFKSIKSKDNKYADITSVVYESDDMSYQGFIYNELQSHTQCVFIDMRFAFGIYEDVQNLMLDHASTPLYCIISSYEYSNNKTKYDKLMQQATNGLIIYDTACNKWKNVFYHENYNDNDISQHENYFELLKKSLLTCISRYKENYLHYIRWNGWGCMNIG